MSNLAIPKKNILLIVIGLCTMILGYVLMAGGGSETLDTFNYEMFSFRRITLAPIVILIGVVIEIVGIMYIPKKEKEEEK